MEGLTNVELTTIIISSLSIIVSVIVALIVYKQTKQNNLKAEIREYLKLGIENVNSKIDKINSNDKSSKIFSIYLTWIMNDIRIFNDSKTIIMDNFQQIIIEQLEDVYTSYYNYLKQLTALLEKSNYKIEEKKNIIKIYIDDMNEQLEYFAINNKDFLEVLKNEKKEFECFCELNLKIRKILIDLK